MGHAGAVVGAGRHVYWKSHTLLGGDSCMGCCGGGCDRRSQGPHFLVEDMCCVVCGCGATCTCSLVHAAAAIPRRLEQLLGICMPTAPNPTPCRCWSLPAPGCRLRGDPSRWPAALYEYFSLLQGMLPTAAQALPVLITASSPVPARPRLPASSWPTCPPSLHVFCFFFTPLCVPSQVVLPAAT